MPLKSLAGVARELIAATDVDDALRIVNRELASAQQAGVMLLAFDGRRNTIIGHGAEHMTSLPGEGERHQVALDHLPVPVRGALLTGEGFADVGEQAVQYARLLGITRLTDDIRLFLKGIILDGTLTGVLVAYEERRRGSAKLMERLKPLAALLELTYARLFERDSRFEAISTLHDVTSRLRGEHAGKIAELEREISRLRNARGDVIDQKRAEELYTAATNAQHRASTAEQRLAAVEAQVTSAVEHLDQAHLQIYRQTEELRVQSETIRRLETHAAEQHAPVTPSVSS